MSTTAIDVDSLESYIAEDIARLAARPRVLPFDDAEYARRHQALLEATHAEDVDVLIVTAPDTMCWLTGYTSRWYRAGASSTLPPTQCLVVAADGGNRYMIDTGFHEQLVRLTSNIEDFRAVPGSDLNHEPGLEEFVQFLIKNLAGEGHARGRVGLELHSWIPTAAVAQVLIAALEADGATTADATRLARGARTRKSPAEITMIERAQGACDGGLLRVQAEVRPGMTALEAGEVYIAGVVAAGGEPAAIQESVFSGPPEPLAHMLNSREPLAHGGGYLHVDGAAGYERYHARGTRVFSFGEPAPQLRRLTEIAGGALEVVREVGRAGIPFATLQRALREYHRDIGLPSEQLFAGGYELGVSLPPDWVGELLWSTSAPDMEESIPEGLVTNFESCAHVAIVDTIVFESAGARTLSSVPTDVLTIAI